MEFLSIFIFGILFSYILMVIYRKFGFHKISLYFDEFSSLKRNQLQNCGGIIFFIIFLILNFYIYIFEFFNFTYRYIFFCISFIVLFFISYIDDVKKLDPKFRLIVQFFCIYFSLAAVPHIIPFIPIKVSILAAIIFWIYIMNITNFIDGADGFASIIIISYFINLLIISYSNNLIIYSNYISVIIIPCLIVFLLYNSPPAKIFMGDCGAIILGFLIGFSMFEMINNGFALLILSSFAYPLTDCTITIIKKTFKGIWPWVRLGDYFFLIPKKNVKKGNALKIERKLFYYILGFSLLSILINLLSVFLNNNYIFLLNFIFALILISIFRSFKKTKST